MSGIAASLAANPFGSDTGCIMDGLPTACSRVLRAINNGQADKVTVTGFSSSVQLSLFTASYASVTTTGSRYRLPPTTTYEDDNGNQYVAYGQPPPASEASVQFVITPGFQLGFEPNPQYSLQQTAPGLMNFNVPKNGKIEANYWKRYGKKLYDCIDKVFGVGTKDAELAKKELAKGLAYLDFSYNSHQIGAMGVTGANQHQPAEAEAVNDPWKGYAGTIYIANNPDSPLFQSVTHEEGNILASRVTKALYGVENQLKYGDPNGIGHSTNPNQRDYDTGANLQKCVHGAKSIDW